MSKKESVQSSPYAAPNTPIASAKKARTSVRRTDHNNERSPMPIRKLIVDDQDDAAVHDERLRKTSLSCPEKPVLFSPNLKYDGDKNEVDQEKPENNSRRAIAGDSNSTIEHAVVTTTEDEDDIDGDEFNPYLFISSLPPHASVMAQGKICLPNNNVPNRMTLALDLDETLVHCTIEPIPKPDVIFPVTFNGTFYQVYVRKRPYLDFFLESVSRCFEVVVFTASQKVYADKLLDLIDPDKTLIQHRLFRDACLCVQGNFIKDLQVLNRDLSKTILVDNSPHAYGYQINNGVPIESWFDDEKDTELVKLIGFLKRIQQNAHSDVRQVIRDHFKTFMLVERAASGQPVLTSAPRF